jgi:hypothetical protein
MALEEQRVPQEEIEAGGSHLVAVALAVEGLAVVEVSPAV